MMLKKIANQPNWILVLILLVATFLRVFLLSEVPNGFHQDEATTGYDAYSLLKTMHSQYGAFFPLFSKAFFDYNESLSRFFTIPFVWIFGLNEFSTRIPIAIIGILTVWLLYHLGKEIFNEKVGLLSALFLAISPWHIQFSRIAYTGVLVPFFFCFGLLFFIKSLKQSKYLPLSGLGFGLTLYTYSPARVFIPIFLCGLTAIFWKHLWKNKKQTFTTFIIFISILIVLLNFWISPEGMTRVRTAGLVSNPGQIFLNYFSYFNPKFLFLIGDPFPRHSPKGIGELYFWELLTVSFGIFGLLKEESKTRSLFFIWLLLYPIPAVLTAPDHALRVIVGAPLFAILSGYGFVKMTDIFRLSNKYRLWLTLFVTILSLSFFCKIYFLDYPKQSNYNIWRYGMKELITYTEKSTNQCVLISNRFHHTSIFILFYSQYDPAIYQRSPIDPSISYQNQAGYSLGKYRITPISSSLEVKQNCLLVLKPGEKEVLKKAGYSWQEIRTIKNPRKQPEIELIQISGET